MFRERFRDYKSSGKMMEGIKKRAWVTCTCSLPSYSGDIDSSPENIKYQKNLADNFGLILDSDDDGKLVVMYDSNIYQTPNTTPSTMILKTKDDSSGVLISVTFGGVLVEKEGGDLVCRLTDNSL